jgi:hypothetical protein
MGSIKRTFVLDAEDDADILAWWDEQDNKSAAIRSAIRAAMRGGDGLDVETMRRVVREELQRAQVAATAGSGRCEDVDAEAGARLDGMF